MSLRKTTRWVLSCLYRILKEAIRGILPTDHSPAKTGKNYEQSPDRSSNQDENKGNTNPVNHQFGSSNGGEETNHPPNTEQPSNQTQDNPDGEVSNRTSKNHSTISDSNNSPTGNSYPRKTKGKRGKNNQPNNDQKQRPRQQPYYDLICVEKAGQWSVAISMLEDYVDKVSVVRQENSDLSPSNHHYDLQDIRHEIEVEFTDGEKESISLLDKKHFLVFKLRKDWKGTGHKVNAISDGYYVVFADKSCGERIGKAPIDPEQCPYPGFMVHFFDPSENGEADGFKKCSPFSIKKRFSLTGKRIHDDADMGDLFIGNAPPKLNDEEEWKAISWIMVGRENGGDVLKILCPDPDKMRTTNIANILNEQKNPSGWFFIRIYETENSTKCHYSTDFRWVKALQAICVNGNPNWQNTPIIPSASGGHSEVRIEFKGNVPVKHEPSRYISKMENNVFSVAPHPDGDATKWIFGNGGDEVKSEMILPRVWWMLTTKGQDNAVWEDKPMRIERENFCQLKDKELRIRLPLCVKKIKVGFNNFSQTLPAKLDDSRETQQVNLRLEDFKDYQEMEEPLREATALRIQLDIDDAVFPVILFPADILDNSEPATILRPDVKSTTGFRRGKGFSEPELQAADISYATIKHRSSGQILFRSNRSSVKIQYDKRRKSKHPKNIETLIAIKQKNNA